MWWNDEGCPRLLSRTHILLLLLSLTFSRRLFSKTEQMVHCTIAAIEWKNGEEWGWVGSGWVGSGERRSLLDSTQASLFLFGSAVTIVPFTVHFVLQYERLEQAMLSLSKLSKKNKIIIIIIIIIIMIKPWCKVQVTTTYIFFESVVEPLITKKESSVVHTLIVTTVMFCNQIMTQQRRLVYLNSL